MITLFSPYISEKPRRLIAMALVMTICFSAVISTVDAGRHYQEQAPSPVHKFYYGNANKTIVGTDLMLGERIPNNPGKDYLVFAATFTTPGKRIHAPKNILLSFTSPLTAWQKKYNKAAFQLVADGKTIVECNLPRYHPIFPGMNRGVSFNKKIPFKLFKEATKGNSIKIVFEEFTFDLTDEELGRLRALVRETEN